MEEEVPRSRGGLNASGPPGLWTPERADSPDLRASTYLPRPETSHSLRHSDPLLRASPGGGDASRTSTETQKFLQSIEYVNWFQPSSARIDSIEGHGRRTRSRNGVERRTMLVMMISSSQTLPADPDPNRSAKLEREQERSK